MPLNQRLAGILLHPTSLPGPFGIGDLGPEATRFIEWMSAAGLAYWQVLPLGPTSFGDSPYQCFSSMAGNPLLVSPEFLVRDGLLDAHETAAPDLPARAVDYGPVIGWKGALLRLAHRRFTEGRGDGLRNAYAHFTARADVVPWLDDFALFMALKDANGGRAWNTWDADLRAHKAKAVAAARDRHAAAVDYHRFAQFLFFHQWDALRAECGRRGISIIGDAPIYVAFDSADVWAHQDLFQLDRDGKPSAVAGVPPDYFSTTGQLWGNPLYNWKRMARDDYAWWVGRMRSILAQVDIVRLDHFRGFMGYWSVPAGEPTAENGTWIKGPGLPFFAKLKEQIGDLPVIAEDLGEITTDVEDARRALGLPGMIIMQFAWSPANGPELMTDPGNGFLPHRHERDMVVYSGTHDNDTSLGWWRNSSTERERAVMQIYLATDGNLASWDLVRASMASVANTAIVPAQDLLNLDSWARMNFPGRAEGNWSWRLQPDQLDQGLAERVRRTTLMYQRCANPPAEAQPPAPKLPPY